MRPLRHSQAVGFCDQAISADSSGRMNPSISVLIYAYYGSEEGDENAEQVVDEFDGPWYCLMSTTRRDTRPHI